MKTGFCFLLASARTISVQWTLVSMVRTGLSTMSSTPTAAARWKTTSASSTSSATIDGEAADSIVYENRRLGLEVADVVDRAGGEVVEDVDTRAAADELLGEMASDEAGTTCQQGAHRTFTEPALVPSATSRAPATEPHQAR